MYLPFFLFVGGLVLLFIVSLYKASESEPWMISGVFSGIIGALVLLISPIITPTCESVVVDKFQLEQTEYRVIVKADGKEWTFKDAETVLQASKRKPVALKLVYRVNVWGVRMENGVNGPQATMIFDKIEK